MTMTTFLLNSLGHDRPRSDPLFIKIYAMVSGRVDSEAEAEASYVAAFLVCYRPLALPRPRPAFVKHRLLDTVVLGLASWKGARIARNFFRDE